MPAFAILRRDLMRLLRSPLRTLFLFAVPLAMAAMFGLAFGGGDDPEITIRVLVYDEDQGLLGQLLQGAAGGAGEQLELVAVGAEGLEMIERGEASALLHLPAGCSDAFLRGEPVTLELIKNPAQRFLPGVVEEGTAIGALILSQISRLFRTELEELAALIEGDGVPDSAAVAVLAQGITDKLHGVERFVFPPVVDLEVTTREATAAAAAPDVGVMAVVFPGLAFFGILFLAQAATRDILHERASGLLRHLLTAPVSIGDYLLGKCLSVVVITLLGFTLLVLVGAAAGVSWGPPPLVLALVLLASLAASGLLLLLASIVKSEAQQDALGTLVIMASSMIGGSMVPLSSLPAALLPVSRLTLNYWAVDGFNDLILRGGGVAEVAPNLLVLGIAGVAFLGAGAFFLHRRLVSGVVA
ncbi:MAG: ABC transporter permease [Acidobacteria bacterium]|nr:MAG: ABC transporter permease [Acidobacteriota bacterium]